MPKADVSSPVPIALGRVDELLARIFAVAAIVLSLDVVRNGFQQLQILNSLWFYTFMSAILLSLAGSFLAAFWLGAMRFWYRAIIFSTLAAMVLWPLQVVDTESLPNDFKPWVWWAVGFASLAATGAFKRNTAIVFLVLMPLVWLIVRVSPFGASENFRIALEDSLYSFFFSTSVSLLVMFLRHRAAQVDSEFEALSAARLERAFLDVMQIERTKINSIIHDSVIASLDAAADANSEAERAAAAKAANEAIMRLEREAARDPMARETLSSQAFFESLKAAIERRSTFVLVKVKSPVDLQIPFEVAVAMAESTFQALNNSLVHAQNALNRKVVLSSTRNSLKILIIDDGVGFRMSSVPKNRLGVRVAIFQRLESLGVKVNLQSSPGEGATWVFEWVNND
jgi:signal transduction histidine kinase